MNEMSGRNERDAPIAACDPRSALCAECNAGHGPNEYHAALCPHYRTNVPETPTLSDVYDRLHDEYDALGMLSYHAAAWDHGNTVWYADLTKDDIEKLRGLLRDAGQAIEGYA